MKVRIKKWESMQEEFGLDSVGNIDCSISFVTDMEKLIPASRVIDICPDLDSPPDSGIFIWEPDGDDHYTWEISMDMVSEILDEEGDSPTDLAMDLMEYINEHPEERFWQAVRNWSGYNFIYVSDELVENDDRVTDTFFKRGK